MARNKKGKWTQIGNYLIGEEKSASGERMVIRSVSGDWRVMWETGTLMYIMIKRFVEDESTHKYIDALATLFYAATNYPHDLVAITEKQSTPFMDGFARLVNEQTDFEVSVKRKPTDEEDEKALSEVVEMQEIQDELEKLEKEDATE